MLTNDLLKTPQEFINEETENVKSFFKDNNDLQINKLGVLGYFINLLGNIRYDSTQYYQKLFQEANVITARDEKNLYLHGAIYKYNFSFAEPSVAEGSFIFDFSLLPLDSSLIKRTVTFQDIAFQIDGIHFKSDTIYKFVEEGDSYYAILYLPDGTITHIPSSSSQIIAPFMNVYQQISKTEKFKLTNYPAFSYYSHKFNTGDLFLNNLDVYVKERNKTYDNNSKGDLFEVKSIKLEENSTTKSCFLTMLQSQEYLLEFGSGIRGKHIPEAEITLIKNLTNGEDGNIGVEYTLKPESTSRAILKKYKDNLNYTSINLSTSLINIHFEYSNNGVNPKIDNELRKDIIKHIQTRDFLISKNDFNNLTDIDDNEFVYTFKKSAIQRNDFFLHQCFRDENQIPIKTLCYNFPSIELGSNIQNLSYSSIYDTEGSLVGTLQYYVFASDGFHISDVVYIMGHCGVNNAIELNWDEYDNANFYIVIVYDGGEYRYFNTYTNTFLDIGQESNAINTFSYIEEDGTDTTITFSWEDNYIFFPEFLIEDVNFISPFIYKYNSFMNWFDGYLFNDDFIILFSQKQEVFNISENHTVPYFHAQIKYNYLERKTEIYIISQQETTNYIPTISITNTLIKDQKLNRVDINKFYIEFDENKYGILLETHSLELIVYYSNDDDEIISEPIVNYATERFSQIEYVYDQIKLLTYLDSTNNNHILSIPIMEKSIYEENKELYNIKLLNNLSNTNLSENRFPNDEIQYRFINSYIIDQIYLRNILKQTYEFDLIFPLKLELVIYYDQVYLDNNNVNLTKEKDDLYLELSQLLEKNYTGNSIKFYNSHIIDYIHKKPFIKTLTVLVKDSNNNIIDSGLESYNENEILENIQNDVYSTDEIMEPKLHICYYTPYYFWWDINNIDITYKFS
jgi:hypothetical protein